MSVKDSLAYNYKLIILENYYEVPTEEALNRLKQAGIINDEGFIFEQEDKELVTIPFKTCNLLFVVKVFNEGMQIWVNLFNQKEPIASIGVDNDIFNLLIKYYNKIVNKPVFDLFCDNVDEFAVLLEKCKNTTKMYKYIRKKIKYGNKKTWAGNPGNIILSDEKYELIGKLLHLDKATTKILNKNKKNIQEHIYYGDTQPAKVLSIYPLIIASYSDEFDAVVLLEFPNEYVQIYNLKKNDRLITINRYNCVPTIGMASDIVPGPYCSYQYRDFTPIVALFVCQNEKHYNRKVKSIEDDEWERLDKMTDVYLEKKTYEVRNGFKYLITDRSSYYSYF